MAPPAHRGAASRAAERRSPKLPERLVFRWNATKSYVHKTARKTQRDRVIFLTPEAQAYTEECIGQFPEGPIYRTLRKARWVQTNCTNNWRRWLLLRPKVVAYLEEHDIDPASVRMYNFRHSWACNYFDRTGDIFGAAMMLGTSVKMLQTRYFHMDEEKLHERYLHFMAADQAGAPTGPGAARVG